MILIKLHFHLMSIRFALQVVDWLCLILDSHMTQFVLSPDAHVTLIKLHCVVSNQVPLLTPFHIHTDQKICVKMLKIILRQ